MYDLAVRLVAAVALVLASRTFLALATDPWWSEEEDVD